VLTEHWKSFACVFHEKEICQFTRFSLGAQKGWNAG
jgi:hypothetical protein